MKKNEYKTKTYFSSNFNVCTIYNCCFSSLCVAKIFGDSNMKNYHVTEETWQRWDGSKYVVRRIVEDVTFKIIGEFQIEYNLSNAIKETVSGR